MECEHRNGEDDIASGLHAVVIPHPLQGHITPALQLAKKLVGFGFRITFVNTVPNHERMMKSRPKAMEPDKGIEFIAVPDGLPDDHPRVYRFEELTDALLKMGPAFEELFVNLLRESPITCVIRDMRMSAVHERAQKLGIPVVGFATPSAISMHCVFHIPTFLSTGMLPLPPPPAHSTSSFHPVKMTLGPPQSDEEAAARQAPLTPCIIPGVSPTMRVEDIPIYLLTHDLNHYIFRLIRVQGPLLADCECILFNTFQDLEGDVLDAMTDHLNANIYSVGPLVLNSSITVEGVEEVAIAGAGSSLMEEDPVALSWLDDQSPGSVLFVSFGSITTISMEQMQEFAYGLEMSGHAFLWVIRPDTLWDSNKEFETIFSEFVKRTRHRALLVPWVPQPAVLSHPSVAAFLTHCGWNSTIESIASGVPMLGWPRYADQNTNCHYITHVWRIGLELQYPSQASTMDGNTVVPKEEVDRKVRKMLAKEDSTDLEIAEIRTNSQRFKMAARKAVVKRGSSETALAKFVELVESWRSPKHPNAL